MIRNLYISLRMFLLMTAMTGFVYPALVTAIGHVIAREKALGSLVSREGTIVGSKLLAQKFSSPRYFSSRPSATDFATLPAGASNLSPTSTSLHKTIKERRMGQSQATALSSTASASGLDPHLTRAEVAAEFERVANARRMTQAQRQALQALIEGEGLVNILELNLALDRLAP